MSILSVDDGVGQWVFVQDGLRRWVECYLGTRGRHLFGEFMRRG